MSKITVEAKNGKNLSEREMSVPDEEQEMLFRVAQKTLALLGKSWADNVQLIKVTAEPKNHYHMERGESVSTEVKFQLVFTPLVPRHLSLISQPTSLEQIKVVVGWDTDDQFMGVRDSNNKWLDSIPLQNRLETTLAATLIRAMKIGIHARQSHFQIMVAWLEDVQDGLVVAVPVPT